MQPTSGKQRRTGTVRARASARRRRSARSSDASRASAGAAGDPRRALVRNASASPRAFGRAPTQLPKRVVERLTDRARPHDRVEIARDERRRPARAELDREIRRVSGATPTPTRSTATATWRAISSSRRRRRRERPGARSTRPTVRTGGNAAACRPDARSVRATWPRRARRGVRLAQPIRGRQSPHDGDERQPDDCAPRDREYRDHARLPLRTMLRIHQPPRAFEPETDEQARRARTSYR